MNKKTFIVAKTPWKCLTFGKANQSLKTLIHELCGRVDKGVDTEEEEVMKELTGVGRRAPAAQ